MRRAKVVVAILFVLGVGYLAYRDLRSAYYALQDSRDEKHCAQELDINDGSGRTCHFSRQEAIDLGGERERSSEKLCSASVTAP